MKSFRLVGSENRARAGNTLLLLGQNRIPACSRLILFQLSADPARNFNSQELEAVAGAGLPTRQAWESQHGIGAGGRAGRCSRYHVSVGPQNFCYTNTV